MKERDIHRQIIDWLRIALPSNSWVGTIPGGDGSRTQSPGYVKGTPDIVCVVPYYPTIFFEVKGPRGVQSPAQESVMRAIVQAGGHAFVVRSIEETAAHLERIPMKVRARLSA